MRIDPLIHAILVKLDDLTLDFSITDHERTPEEIQGFCDRVINMSLLESLNLTKQEEIGLLLQDLFNYVQFRFSQKASSVMVVAGWTVTVESLMVNPLHRLKEQALNTSGSGGRDGRSPLFATPSNLEFMRRQMQEQQSRELFRPFLVRSIYSHLVGKAFLGHTTTYEAIANEFGLPNKGNQLGSTLSPLLSDIYHFCEKSDQPHLTALVVRKSGEMKDVPGQGFWDLYNQYAYLGQEVNDLADKRKYTKVLQKRVFDYWGFLGK